MTPITCINRIEIAGTVGSIKISDLCGTRTARFSVATSYCYKDKDKQIQIHTTWFSVLAFEIPHLMLEGLEKGSIVHLFGRVRNVEYTGADGVVRTATEVLATELEVLNEPERLIFETERDHPTLSERLTALDKDAFAKVKDALRELGGSCILEDGHILIVDTCTDYGFVYHFEAKKVKLVGDHVLILREMDEESEKFITEGGGCEPDECWWEGSEWYAEWEGLLEIFDEVIDTAGM